MGVNPDTNRFESLSGAPDSIVDALNQEQNSLRKKAFEQFAELVEEKRILRPDGTPVPKHWATFCVGEQIVIKNYTFKVGYIGESTLLLEPVGPVMLEREEK